MVRTTRQSGGEARARAFACSPSQPPLAGLPPELIERTLHHIDAMRDLAAANAASRLFRGAPGGRSPVEHALRARARARGHERALPTELPAGVRTWTEELFARERVAASARAHSTVVACGDSSSAFVDAEGGLHTCGEEAVRDEHTGQPTGDYRSHVALGHSGDDPVLLPTRVASLSAVRIRAVAAVTQHLLALSEAGTVYACGDNSCGQLGLGDAAARRVFEQVRGLGAQLIVGIAAGVGHSLALSAAGCAYSWGANNCGQLGHGDTEERREPTRIEALDGVRVGGAGAGVMHTLLLSTTGSVYSCGHGGCGQLGHGDGQAQHTPRRIEALAGVRAVHVSAGGWHNLVVDAAGGVHSFGSGGRGCLAHGGTAAHSAPRRVDALAGVHAVRASASSLLSSAVLGADGSAHAFGNNVDNLLGLGLGVAATRVVQPTRLVVSGQARVVDCSVGGDHALYVTADGSVHSCGERSAALGRGTTTAAGGWRGGAECHPLAHAHRAPAARAAT